MSAPVEVERSAGVTTLRLAQPRRRNALSAAVLTILRDELAPARLAATTAVVLTAAGASFSAGADLGELTGTSADLAFDDLLAEVTTAIRQAPVPVVAAIEGACVGAAVDLAMACDVRIASETAFFGVPAVRLGLLYNPDSLVRLREALPSQTSARLLLLGERIGGHDAVAAGLACCCVPAGTALERAHALAADAPTTSREAMCATKALLTGEADAAGSRAVRMRLLDSPERLRAVTAAKQRLHSKG